MRRPRGSAKTLGRPPRASTSTRTPRAFADNVALELGNLQHGLLTYSLVKNGIEFGQADFQPKDNKLFSNEWLNYAVKDVPQLYEQLSKGEIKCLTINGEKPKGVEVYYLDGQKSNLNLQQPSLFDFSRRDRQFELFNVSLMNTNGNLSPCKSP